ncbi:MAG: hypothetical protein Kow0063_14920 [Anaerolineae bacterium]
MAIVLLSCFENGFRSPDWQSALPQFLSSAMFCSTMATVVKKERCLSVVEAEGEKDRASGLSIPLMEFYAKTPLHASRV